MMKKTCLISLLALATSAASYAQTIINPLETYRANGTTGSIGNFDATGSSYLGGAQFSDTSFGVGINNSPLQFRGFALFDLNPVLTEVGAATSIVLETGGFSFLNGGGAGPDWTVEVVSPQDSIASINIEFFGVYGGNTEGVAGTFDPAALSFNEQVQVDVTSIVKAAGFNATDRYLWIRFRPSENGQVGGVNTVGGFNQDPAQWTLTIVPEPSAYALIAGSLALGWIMLRRRK